MFERVILLWALPLVPLAIQASSLITFNGGTDNQPIAGFYSSQGVIFANATWDDSYSFLSPPTTDASKGTYLIDINDTGFNPGYSPTVSSPIVGTLLGTGALSISIQAIDVGTAGVELDAYNAQSQLVGNAVYYGPDGGSGITTTLSVSAANIARFNLYQPSPNATDGVWFDDLNIVTPEPGAFGLVAFPILFLALFKLRKYCPISRDRLKLVWSCMGGLLVFGLLGSHPAYGQNACGAWMDTTLSADERAGILLSNMSEAQKFQMTHGGGSATNGQVGFINAIPSLCIPALGYCDGSVGVGNSTGQNVQLGSSQANVATFDSQRWRNFGLVIGRENWNRGCTISLGGNMNNAGREPRDGRTFEQKGEDPILAGKVAAQQDIATQSQNVIAGVKHYAFNDQETNRQGGLATINERNARESDLISFEIGVKDGNAASVMCAYNKINTIYSCEQPHFLTEVLKDDWGFKGFVMSDWGGTHSTVNAINAGLDQEMPSGSNFSTTNLTNALNANQIQQSEIDGMVYRVLRSMFAVGVFDNPPVLTPRASQLPQGVITADTAIAQDNLEQGAVLLQNNNNVLPLNAATVGSIALIGSHADVGTLSGGGSAGVTPVGGGLTFSGQSGTWVRSAPLTAIQALAPAATVTFDPGTSLASAASAASSANVAIVFVNQYEAEGSDLSTLELPTFQGISQDSLIAAVAAVNPRTIVVVESGSPIFMPWLSSVASVLEAWYPGQGGGPAIANLLFGVVNPSGKLPLTFPASLSQLPRPTVPNVLANPINYNIEGYKVGYKWYDSQNLTPLFPFGFGLSYTTFSFSNLLLTPANGTLGVSFSITNTGPVAGAEVGEVYLGLPTATGEPKRLVGWQKVVLAPGATQNVSMTLNSQDSSHPFSMWGPNGWLIVNGAYTVYVGDSSRSLPLSSTTSISGWVDNDPQ